MSTLRDNVIALTVLADYAKEATGKDAEFRGILTELDSKTDRTDRDQYTVLKSVTDHARRKLKSAKGNDSSRQWYKNLEAAIKIFDNEIRPVVLP